MYSRLLPFEINFSNKLYSQRLMEEQIVFPKSYCQTLYFCGIKISRFDENDNLAQIYFGVYVIKSFR